ncbi:MAG: Gfo/Idh/MocA family oxidoreductase [Silicimonas sp.]|nr:Gfo/Idh/MocA family oxidoreductase [Silicimonas sp.]
MQTLGIGIIGCGNISETYLRLAPLFRGIQIRSVADIDMAAASARAKEFGTRADTVDGLLAAEDIDIVVNLTIPSAHFDVCSKALAAGKHVYSEKPFVLTLDEGLKIRKMANDRGLRVGSAPDTFLGGAHQAARRLIDDGTLGTVSSGTAFVMSHGMEHWHPNPDFFFLPGAGPVLDLGPYYIANLVQLIGPIRRVAALAATPSPTRTILSEPRRGETIPVETPTTIHGLLEFCSGAAVTLVASWDVWDHGHSPMELYGSEGTLYLPDPNFFGGDLKMTTAQGDAKDLASSDHPFGVVNDGDQANYRTAGLADMAQAIRNNHPHRCSMDLALHGVEVMTGLLQSGETGQFVTMTTTCDRPAALGPADARALLA